MYDRQRDLAAENERLRLHVAEAGENAERAFALMAACDADCAEALRRGRAGSAGRVAALERELAAVRDRLHAAEHAAARLQARYEHQRGLMRELSHRLRNALTLVQAMVGQTLREPTTLSDGRATLLARIVALGQAHAVLIDERWLGTTVRRTVETALATHAGPDTAGRFAVAGPRVRLGSRQTVALSMALHELATNSAKYGSLSCEAGRVRIAWHTAREADGRRLHLAWSEHDGPPVRPPGRRGFGSRLIERTVTDTLGGTVDLRFDPAGVVCTLSAPVAPAGRG
ncbi:sensor histidine kinase [Methylobacterium sp. NEAU 140]|uniref:sensor histidine kinase n=1 Tax=Methylobacterium sp. NEAU 140 TaxID=3064945 RepID=UPI0027366272|nr:sensor histidine kinase [Methylobacterium sp. NEAU 140]MDP4024885.1 sensor histidine kinase [Methylobacterium sp. NEAU 140]